jgi:hypothetical protein
VAVARPMIDAVVFEPDPEHLNWATIPSSAPADPIELPDDVAQAELATEDNGDAVVEQWKPEHRVVRAEPQDDDELRIRTFNFPGWTATIDGKQVPIRSSQELGNIELDVPAGTHQVTLDFRDTKVRRTFRIVTLCSFVVLMGLCLAPFARRTRVG